jgi:hypothetical protein
MVWAGVAGLALAAPAAAQPPEDPIAASNRMIDPWVAPKAPIMEAEGQWKVPSAAEPAGKALLARIKSQAATQAPTPTPAPTVIAPTQGTPPTPTITAATPALPPAPAMPIEPAASTIPDPAPVSWSAPPRKPITNILPTSDRPMIPCEPVAAAPPKPPVDPPAERLPPPTPLKPETPPAPPQPSTMKATPPDDDPPARTVTTIRFLDEPAAKPPADDDNLILAIVRRGGSTTGTAADIRTAVEKTCNGKAECQTEVCGERQVRVMLTVKNQADWDKLFERMQNLPELGEYGLLFQVRVEK